MNLSRLLCLAVVLDVLLGLSSSLVEAASWTDPSNHDSAPVAPLNEESADACETDFEVDDLAWVGVAAVDAAAHAGSSETLSDRGLLLLLSSRNGHLPPRAPPAC